MILTNIIPAYSYAKIYMQNGNPFKVEISASLCGITTICGYEIKKEGERIEFIFGENEIYIYKSSIKICTLHNLNVEQEKNELVTEIIENIKSSSYEIGNTLIETEDYIEGYVYITC